MIEIKAKVHVQDEKIKGTNVKCNIGGKGEEIIHESLGIIESLMRNLKTENKEIHSIVLEKIIENPDILTATNDKRIKVIKESLEIMRLH